MHEGTRVGPNRTHWKTRARGTVLMAKLWMRTGYTAAWSPRKAWAQKVEKWISAGRGALLATYLSAYRHPRVVLGCWHWVYYWLLQAAGDQQAAAATTLSIVDSEVAQEPSQQLGAGAMAAETPRVSSGMLASRSHKRLEINVQLFCQSGGTEALHLRLRR